MANFRSRVNTRQWHHGVLLPMSGDAGSYGESMKEAIDLALAEAEADGSLPANLTVVWGDSATDPAKGREEIRRFAGQIDTEPFKS